jgi:hypothetical protein
MMAMVRPAADSRSAMQTKHDIITVREAFLQNEIPPQRTAWPPASGEQSKKWPQKAR